jgi:hypothetical protein
MLVALADPSFETTPVGLAVMAWHVGGETMMVVIFPINTKMGSFVQAWILTEGDPYKIISPATGEWQHQLEYGLSESTEGYPVDEETATNLYEVWDDGALRRTEQAEALYTAYQTLIDHFTPAARAYIKEDSERRYNQARKHAKTHGFDLALIERDKTSFPYGSTQENGPEAS